MAELTLKTRPKSAAPSRGGVNPSADAAVGPHPEAESSPDAPGGFYASGPVMSLGAPVQPKLATDTAAEGGSSDVGTSTETVQSVASDGLRGASRPLPGIDRIRSSFGRHEIGETKVQVAGPATRANAQLQSRAYTQGSRIAFKEEPDLKLAAHEAAHVVQQRRGVQLKGDVGKPGDPYEQQADRAADAVVGGRTAEPILDEDPREGKTGVVVQKACHCGGSGCASCRDEKEKAPVQAKLEVNADRQFEPPAIETAMPGKGRPAGAGAGAKAGGGPQGAKPAPASGQPQGAAPTAAAQPPGAAPSPQPTPGGQPGAPQPQGTAPPVPAGDGAPAAPGGPQPGASGGEKACKAGRETAHCYSEPIEEPDPEPDEKKEDPPVTESREDMSSESPQAQVIDICPVEQAIQAQVRGGPATAAASGGPATSAPAASGPATSAPAAASGGSSGPSAAGDAATPHANAKGAEAASEASQDSPPETKAMSDRAEANGGDAEEARSPMDRSIARAEAQRGDAVAAYQTSAAQIEAARESNRALSGSVTFADEGANAAEARGRASNFFAKATDRIDAALDFALSEVPDRLGSLAESVKGDIETSIQAQKESISARIAAARGHAYTSAGAARRRVTTEHATAVAALEADTAKAIKALTTAHQTSLGSIDEPETTALDTINALYEEGRTAHEDVGTKISAKAIARGEVFYNAYEVCKIHEDDSFWAGALTDRRAEAQQKASRETAKGFAKSLDDAAKKQAREAMKGRQKDRCAVIAAARQARTTLDEQFDAIVKSLESGLEQAKLVADGSRDQLLGSIDDALFATLRTLDQQEHSQRQAADDVGYLQQVTVEQVAHTAASSIQDAASRASAALQRALQEMRGTFAESPAPYPAALDRLLSQSTTRIDAAIDRVLTQLEIGTAGSEGRLESVGVDAMSALLQVTQSNDEQASQVTSGYSGSMASLGAGAAASFLKQSGQYGKQVQESSDRGVAGLKGVVDGFKTSLAAIEQAVTGALVDSAKKLDQSLHESLAGLDCEIPKQATKAAAKEQPAWKTVVAVILIIAVIVVVALVIGPAVIGAVGAAASALGASAATASVIGAVVGGAIVGAATSATIQVLNNFRTGQRLSAGVGRAAIMGAIGGALGGGAGFLVGKFVTGAVLRFAVQIAADAVLEAGTELVTGEFSWESLGIAVLMSAVTGGFGEIKGVKAIQGRMQVRGAHVVPGARASAFAEHLRISAAAHEAPGPSRAATEGEAHVGRPAEQTAAPRTEEPSASRTEPVGEAPTRTGEPTAATRSEGEARAGARPLEEGGSPPPREGDRPRAEGEVEAAAARSEAGPKPGTDLDAPANRLSDTELAETTTNRTVVGEEEHAVAFRRDGDQVECEVCSFGCGNIKRRIDVMAEALPEGSPLRGQLAEIRERVAVVEAGIENASISHADAIKASGEIASRLRELGSRNPELGQALNDPHVFENPHQPPTEAGGRERIRTDDLGAEAAIEGRQAVDVDKLGELDIPKDTPLLYVVRDRETGAVLKVGQTTRDPQTRFGRYNRAAGELGLNLEIEVTPVTNLRGQTIEHYESLLRSRLEAAGHIMPWDYTVLPGAGGAGRLGREGPGVPFQPLPGETSSRLAREGYAWERGEGVRQGYLLPSGEAVSTTPRPRGTLTIDLVTEGINQGLSNAEIARRAGVDKSAVSHARRRWGI